MTVINQAELDELIRLDQVLMWSIISINASNLDARNNYISDNAAIRAESKDYITWQVGQDENGNGQFTFTALLPIVNPHPLQDKQSILDRVWSYSPYDPDMLTESGITGYGEGVSGLPSWIDTTEKLLAFCAVRATTVCKLAPLVRGNLAALSEIKRQYWGSCQYQITDSAYGSQMTITGYLTMNWASYIGGKSLIRCLDPIPRHASDVSCNFPSITELFNIAAIDLTLPVADLIPLIPAGDYGFPPGGKLPPQIVGDPFVSAEQLIDSYGQNYFIDDALPDWYKDAIDNPPQLQTFLTGIGNVSSSDAQAPRIIESLPICKEQDPAVVNYGKSPLAAVLAGK
jgi:hypothetical protein